MERAPMNKPRPCISIDDADYLSLRVIEQSQCLEDFILGIEEQLERGLITLDEAKQVVTDFNDIGVH